MTDAFFPRLAVQTTITFTATDGTAAYSATLLKAAVADGSLTAAMLSDPDFLDALTAAGITVTGVSATVVTSSAVSSIGMGSFSLLVAGLALLASAWL